MSQPLRWIFRSGAQILNLLVTLQENHGLTYVLISHNVSVIRHKERSGGGDVSRADCRTGRRAAGADGTCTSIHPDYRWIPSPPLINRWRKNGHYVKRICRETARCRKGCFFYERPLATHGCEVRQSLAIRRTDVSSRCWRGAVEMLTTHQAFTRPDASSGNALRFQLVIQRNFRFQYLRDRASCFAFWMMPSKVEASIPGTATSLFSAIS